MTKVPFPVASGCVALLLANLGNRDLLRVEPDGGLRTEGAQDSDPYVVTTCQETCPGSRANGLRHVKVGEFPSLLGHPVEVWGRVVLCPERADVRIAHVVHEHDYDVRLFLGPEASQREKKQKKICKIGIHGFC